MPPKEKRLVKQFLEEILEGGSMGETIRWKDRSRLTFEILWLHANSPEWTESHGAVFKEWAINKGRYTQNADGTWPPDDYTNWKANFRCAIDRSNDIVEVKEGDSLNKLLKTYRFIERAGRVTTSWIDNENGTTHGTSVNLMGPTFMPTGTDTYHTAVFGGDVVPEVVEKMPVTPPISMDLAPESPANPDILQEALEFADYNNHPNSLVGELLGQGPLAAEKNMTSLMDIASLESLGIDPTQVGNISLPDSLSMLKFVKNPEMMDMSVWLKYREKVIAKEYIRCDRGCRIINLSGEDLPDIPEEFCGKLIGTPAPGVHVTRNVEDTEQILKALGKGGLHLFCDTEGSIHATRLSSCRVFCSDPTLKNAAEPQMLPRKQTIKVFDRKTFMERLLQWEKDPSSGERPSISVLLALGERWSLSKPINKCHVNVMVVHSFSWNQRMAIKAAGATEIEDIDELPETDDGEQPKDQ